jgi:hypothetical protein
VFDPRFFIDTSNGRPVFRARRDTVLLHLGHPLLQRALTMFSRARFPGSDTTSSRWTVRRGLIPASTDALVLVTVEELAVNDLRESFHHWVRTLAFPVRSGELMEPLPHQAADIWRSYEPLGDPADLIAARALWSEHGTDLRKMLQQQAARLTEQLHVVLEREQALALDQERQRFQSRQGELSTLIEQQRQRSREQRLSDIETELQQIALFADDRRVAELVQNKRLLEDELARRDRHYEELRAQLTRERERIVEHLIPRRYTMRGDAQVFPVTVEIRLPSRTA